MPIRIHTPRNHVLFDVAEEHFNELEFSLEQWHSAIRSPDYTLTEVESGPERLVLAHLDGLCLSAGAGFREIVKPVLSEPSEADPGLLRAAVVVALRLGEHEALKTAIWETDGEQQEAVLQGFGLGQQESTSHWVTESFASSRDSHERATWLRLANACHRGVENLRLSLVSCDSSEVEAAVAAARWSHSRANATIVDGLLDSGSKSLRMAALRTGLSFGSRPAWDALHRDAEDPSACEEEHLKLLALLSGPESHPHLLAALARVQHRRAAIRALGLSGGPRLVEPLISLLGDDDDAAARLAGEALALITGLDVNDAAEQPNSSPDEQAESYASLPDLEEDDLSADLRPGDESSLPRLEQEKVARWWHTRRVSLEGNRRFFRGSGDFLGAYRHALSNDSMRTRAAVAESIQLRSSSRLFVDTSGWTARQRSQVTLISSAERSEIRSWTTNW